jgi:prephenate dehydratase
VQDRAVEWSLVPIENSIEGSVTVTLDTLVGEGSDVAIVGEVVLPVRHYLIARAQLELREIHTIVSHPHVPGQCTRFLHERLPHARMVAATSTAEAVRLIAEHQPDVSDLAPEQRAPPPGPSSVGAATGIRGDTAIDEGWAAIGTRLAARLYGCAVIAEEIQDREDNETRFVWLARTDSSAGAPPFRPALGDTAASKTSLVFWGAGADRAGWLVLCLDEFARRGINLTKIESRPMRERLGQYMFFLDLEGSLTEELVSEALTGLQGMCEQVRIFGSYPVAAGARDAQSRAD